MPGVMHYLQQGGAVILSVAVLLLSMSVLTWCLALGKAWGLWRAGRLAAVVPAAFWSASTAEAGLAAVRRLDGEGLFAPIVAAGATAVGDAAPPSSLESRSDQGERVTRSIRHALVSAQRRLESGQTLLATMASVSPFVGLLGTVWGIYHALLGVATSGQPSLSDVAGPVGEALIMTAFGLAVAIPAVIAYNLLGRAIRTRSEELDGFAGDVHRFFAPRSGHAGASVVENAEIARTADRVGRDATGSRP